MEISLQANTNFHKLYPGEVFPKWKNPPAEGIPEIGKMSESLCLRIYKYWQLLYLHMLLSNWKLPHFLSLLFFDIWLISPFPGSYQFQSSSGAPPSSYKINILGVQNWLHPSCMHSFPVDPTQTASPLSMSFQWNPSKLCKKEL